MCTRVMAQVRSHWSERRDFENILQGMLAYFPNSSTQEAEVKSLMSEVLGNHSP